MYVYRDWRYVCVCVCADVCLCVCIQVGGMFVCMCAETGGMFVCMCAEIEVCVSLRLNISTRVPLLWF